MVQSIDFLPASYHESKVRYRRKIWRRGILVITLTLIVIGTFEQRRQQKNLEAKCREVQQHAKKLTNSLNDASELRRRKHELQAKANLITYLRVNVPSTLLLSTVTNSLPEYVSLRSFRSTYEVGESTSAKDKHRPKPKSKGKKNDDAETKLAAEMDSEMLSEKSKLNDVFLTLTGIAPDDVAISHYLGNLNETKIFQEVKLIYSDRAALRELPMRTFEIRLRVKKPGSLVEPSEKVAGNKAGQSA